jgi:hypothetical protein
MKIILQIIPWLVLLLSFVILVVFYDLIPKEVLITRSFFGDEATVAPKSFFTVFRVPLIEVVCATAIEIMRRKFTNVNADYYAMWTILLYTVAFKSLFQTIEIVSSVRYANIFFYLTFAVVIVGVILALLKGRKFFSNFLNNSSAFNGFEKAFLLLVLMAYLGLAIIPIFVFK